MKLESSRWSPKLRSQAGRGLVLSAIAAGLLAAGATGMAEIRAQAGKCPAAEKVSALLASWRAAAAEAKALPSEALAKDRARLASIAKECPVGARLGETIGFVKAVLSHSLAVEADGAKHCPLAASAPCAATEAKAARSKLIKDLDELAGHALGALGSEGTAKETAGALRGTEEFARDLTVRAAALKASWEKAPAELALVPPEKRQQAEASVKEIAARNKTVGLIPETVAALGTAFQAIEALNGTLTEWAKAHPEAIKDIPEASRKKVEGQFALLDATGDILQAAAKCCGEACKSTPVDTAAGD